MFCPSFFLSVFLYVTWDSSDLIISYLLTHFGRAAKSQVCSQPCLSAIADKKSSLCPVFLALCWCLIPMRPMNHISLWWYWTDDQGKCLFKAIWQTIIFKNVYSGLGSLKQKYAFSPSFADSPSRWAWGLRQRVQPLRETGHLLDGLTHLHNKLSESVMPSTPGIVYSPLIRPC